jgi:pimeloyl-ACP methyl ester carboxylesterase
MNLSLFAHFSFKDTDVQKAIKSNHIPTLFIHGEPDTYVNLANAKELYASNPGYKEMYTFPGAAHASSITVDRAKYKERVSILLKNIKKD